MAVENTHYGATAIAEALQNCNSIFFIGIGGVSMSALAELSIRTGFRVGGSDNSQTATTDALKAIGAEIFLGHDAAHVEGYDAVVYTVAIHPQNPEYLAAVVAGKPTISRADYLGYLMTSFRTRIGVAGMHGKTTCTAMCAKILIAAADPTVFCGAALPALQSRSYCIGAAREHFLFEACEYMDSFLDFYPSLAVVLNIGLDHVDYFHSMEQIRNSFRRYAERVGNEGSLLFNADDAESITTFASFKGKKHTFGIQSDADFTARNVAFDRGVASFDFHHHSQLLCRISIPVMGMHNVYNALAAASAAYLAGIAPNVIQSALSSFEGACRRMQYKGKLPCGAVLYDDYAHHPDEIKATLAGARQNGFSRILCVYQPHTYSRTAGLFDEFSTAFSDADAVFFADVYAAREQNTFGITSADLAHAIPHATYHPSFAALANAIHATAQDGDLVLVMGAGDINRIFDIL